ncbi:hypothetical protein ACQ4PT_043146 [Festuca glaucescens]
MTDGHLFNNILLGGRTGTNPGQFEVSSGGLTWNRQGGGETIRIDKADITSVKWMKVPRAYQLEVRTNDGLFYKFIGFREQVLWEAILKGNDRSSSNEEAVVTFDGIAILTPRGRYGAELHLSFLRLQGQANDFKIQYSTIIRLFVLYFTACTDLMLFILLMLNMKVTVWHDCALQSNNPHTLVVVTLDPPIRKGKTLYPHIVIQFETETIVEKSMKLRRELLAEKYKGRLEESYQGLVHEVFVKALRGLSGARVTRPGSFRNSQDGYAVKSSLKAEDGLLYPLERSSLLNLNVMALGEPVCHLIILTSSSS